jgi:hypothetical protein
MGTSQSDATLRAARNQSLIRAINERIEEVNESFRLALEEAEYVCECADNDCMDRIALTPDAYQEVRRVPTHFFIRREHVHPYFETVVQSHDGYVVVVKFGEAGAEAVALARETLRSDPQGPSALTRNVTDVTR